MPIEKIEKVSRALKKTIQAPDALANPDHFAALMKQSRAKPEPVAKVEVDTSLKVNSPIEEARDISRKQSQVSGVSANEIVSQTKDVIAQIDTLKTTLQTPNLNINGPVKNILRNKLEHVNESLKIAISKAGGENPVYEKPTGLMSPMDRFLGLLTHGQNQLQTLASDIMKIQDKDGNITPANMLLIQVKVANISQEVELFTSMLNKALESTKAIMNVQV